MPHGDAQHLAKRWNERVKLVATLFNALAIISLATAVINPVSNRHYDVVSDGGWILLLAAASLHFAAHGAFHFLQAED